MNYIYSALLLHSAGKPISEENVRSIVKSVEEPNDAKIKALVAALEGVNIEEAISKAAMPVAVAAAPVAVPVAAKEEVSEAEQEKKAEEAAEGLSALFG